MVHLGSALEQGVIEQLQDAGLTSASTVKVLQLAGASGQRLYLTTSNNWTTGANL